MTTRTSRLISRKTFITHAARASVVAFAMPRFGRAATDSAHSPPRTAAVIGHTGRGDYGHGLDEIFQKRPGITLVAVADADPTGLAQATAKLKPARSYADYREMLAREKPNLVSVATRQADQHRDMVRAALEVGAHVYCEKPFTITPADAEELLTLAKARGLKIAVAHQMRLAPAVVRLKTAVTDGLLGRLLELRGYGKQDSRAGGEDMMVLGTHIFDLMRLFAGNPLSCTARVQVQGRDITMADAHRVKDDIGLVAGDEVMAAFAFAHGVEGKFTSRAALRETVGAWGLELIGSKGTARINANIPPRIFVQKTSGWRTDGRTDEWQPFALDAETSGASGSPSTIANARLVDDWLKAIAANSEPGASGDNAARTVQMVMAVYQSALCACRVSFPWPSSAIRSRRKLAEALDHSGVAGRPGPPGPFGPGTGLGRRGRRSGSTKVSPLSGTSNCWTTFAMRRTFAE